MGKPNFALLIGKPKGKPDDDGMVKDDGPPMPEKEGGDKEQMEDGAVQDFIASIHAKDPMGAKQALKDFLELCYPELGGGEESSEPDGDEGPGGY